MKSVFVLRWRDISDFIENIMHNPDKSFVVVCLVVAMVLFWFLIVRGSKKDANKK